MATGRFPLPDTLTLLVVDDHPLIRQGVRDLVGTAVHELTLLEAARADEARQRLRASSPDAIIMDMLLPDISGVDLVREMRNEGMNMPVLILSMSGNGADVERALRAGACGYVLKEEAGGVLLEALARILAGEVHLSPLIARKIAERMASAGSFDALVPERLTDRELEIWRHLGNGLSTRKIASILGISPKTVETHCYNIRGKTEIGDMTELIHEATRWVHSGEPPFSP